MTSIWENKDLHIHCIEESLNSNFDLKIGDIFWPKTLLELISLKIL